MSEYQFSNILKYQIRQLASSLDEMVMLQLTPLNLLSLFLTLK
jgi:hypothetical protein